jgi:ATP synthase protein I
MDTATYRVVGVQATVVLLAAAASFFLMDPGVAIAVLYGGLVAIASMLMLAFRMREKDSDMHSDPHRHLRTFYRTALERFVFVGALLAAGIGLLELPPLPLVAGFVLGQLTLIVSQISVR